MNPGIYPDLSDREYFTQTEWVSYSQLKRHLPEWFKPFSGSSAADFGSVFHERFTGQATPVTAVDAATWQGKAAQASRKQITDSGGYAILSGDIPLLDGMESAVRNHPEACRLLVEEPGTWEASIFADVDGIPCKARFDKLLDDGTAIDVKTTKSGPGAFTLTRSILDYGYDLQAHHYTQVAKAAGVDLTSFLFVFVGKDSPHHVTVCELDDEFMERAEHLRELALSRYLHPTMVEAYAGQTERLRLQLPRWARL